MAMIYDPKPFFITATRSPASKNWKKSQKRRPEISNYYANFFYIHDHAVTRTFSPFYALHS